MELNQESRAERYRADARLARSEAALPENQAVAATLLEIARLFDIVAEAIAPDKAGGQMTG